MRTCSFFEQGRKAVRSLSPFLCHQFQNIRAYVKRSISEVALQSFIVESIFIYPFGCFHILKGLYADIWASEKTFHSSGTITKHWGRWRVFVRVKKSNMSLWFSLSHCKSFTSIRNFICFPFSELRIVSHCLIALTVPTVEISSPTLLVCKTFYCKCDSFLVFWYIVHSYAERCHCSLITKLQKKFPLHIHK
jgi:hypothetical protein